MAEEKKSSGKKKHTGGGISFGLEIILFILALFILWVLMGMPQSENTNKPFIKSYTPSVQE